MIFLLACAEVLGMGWDPQLCPGIVAGTRAYAQECCLPGRSTYVPPRLSLCGMKDQSKGFVSLGKMVIIQGWIKMSQVRREGNQGGEPKSRERRPTFISVAEI